MNPKRALFLYYELAGYFTACLKKLAGNGVEIHVMRYPVNEVAPFRFDENNNGLFFYERNEYHRRQMTALAEKINPGFVFCSGWNDKDYLAVSRGFAKKIPVVLTFDNPWRNTIKQNIASLLAPWYLPEIFTHCWVPGKPQLAYAKKLGFKDDILMEGMYSADVDLFTGYFNRFREKKEKSFPKRFLFVGRYTKLKGVREMWKAFEQLQKDFPNEWELWCLGKGELDNEFPKHDKIKNFGFVQPSELQHYIENAGVFILPAHYEHWGVVVHEFAAAGFPLVCSTSTGAATTFLKDGYNGFFHEPYKQQAIYDVMKKIILLPDEKLFEMGVNSTLMANKITPGAWANTILKLMQ